MKMSQSELCWSLRDQQKQIIMAKKLSVSIRVLLEFKRSYMKKQFIAAIFVSIRVLLELERS